MSVPKYRIVLLGWLLLVCAHAEGQVQRHIAIAVVDEDGVPVPSARVVLTTSDGSQSLRCQTGTAGTCVLTVTGAGPFTARVEKETFYAAEAGDLHFDQISSIELMLVHQREVREVVDVVESRPAINPEQINAQEQISGVDVINLPYPVTRDYRNVLNWRFSQTAASTRTSFRLSLRPRCLRHSTSCCGDSRLQMTRAKAICCATC